MIQDALDQADDVLGNWATLDEPAATHESNGE
jgi:hypothetical protein